MPIAKPRQTAAPAVQFAATPVPEPTNWSGIATLLVGAVVLAGAFYVAMHPGGQGEPKDVRPAWSAQEQPQTPRGPDAYFLPAPGNSQLTQPAGAQPSPVALTAAEQVEKAARELQEQQAQQQLLKQPQLQQPQQAQQQPMVQQRHIEAAPTPDEMGEQYWRRRTHDVQEALRSSALRCVSHMATGAVGVGDVSTSAFAEVRGQYVTAVSTYDALVEDARRAGALKSWVRLEFDVSRDIKDWLSDKNRCR